MDTVARARGGVRPHWGYPRASRAAGWPQVVLSLPDPSRHHFDPSGHHFYKQALARAALSVTRAAPSSAIRYSRCPGRHHPLLALSRAPSFVREFVSSFKRVRLSRETAFIGFQMHLLYSSVSKLNSFSLCRVSVLRTQIKASMYP